ncbi:MAG: 4Fe-4S dicluster domain-containing protein [Gaiellaceae bacterium]
MVRPADYPPPFEFSEAIAPASDPEQDRIEVGILIVGAGPAGLACAIRLEQLLADAPELSERLGEVPVAVLEKGRRPGSHLLSGAVVNPAPLARLLGTDLEAAPFAGEVERESVYFLTPRRAWRVPTPPTMRNRGNRVVSLSRLGTFLAERAEQLGAMILPETPAQRLLVEDGRVRGVRSGDRGRGRNGEPLPGFEPGSDILARATVLAEGSQGHLTGAAIRHFGLEGKSAQTWSLGVKEVWRVPRPLDRAVHTLGWPLRASRRLGEFGGSFAYPLGDDMVALGMVVGLGYRDVGISPHDLLQKLKTHPLIRTILAGGERVAWGAKTIPEGGFHALPRHFSAPGLILCGDGAGLVNVPALKGIHYAVESGMLAAEAIVAALSSDDEAFDLDSYDLAVRRSFIWRDLWRVRAMRQGFDHGLLAGAALAGLATISGGRIPRGRPAVERDDAQPLTRTVRRLPAADGTLTFDKLSSVYASGNRTRDDQPGHVHIASPVPRELAELWVNMCPAQVYELGPETNGAVEVRLTPSNCIQCGAISARGGRLTPPEGGSGPEYTLT